MQWWTIQNKLHETVVSDFRAESCSEIRRSDLSLFCALRGSVMWAFEAGLGDSSGKESIVWTAKARSSLAVLITWAVVLSH